MNENVRQYTEQVFEVQDQGIFVQGRRAIMGADDSSVIALKAFMIRQTGPMAGDLTELGSFACRIDLLRELLDAVER